MLYLFVASTISVIGSAEVNYHGLSRFVDAFSLRRNNIENIRPDAYLGEGTGVSAQGAATGPHFGRQLGPFVFAIRLRDNVKLQQIMLYELDIGGCNKSNTAIMSCSYHNEK